MMTIRGFEGEYRYLSNFWPAKVRFEGIEFSTVEHAYQAAKTLSREERELIAQLVSPGQAKRKGRYVTLRKDWERVKVQIMYGLLKQKFSIPHLQAKLLAIQFRMKFVESNTWHDKFWGICDCPSCHSTGKNTLGLLIQLIHAELHKQEANDVAEALIQVITDARKAV